MRIRAIHVALILAGTLVLFFRKGLFTEDVLYFRDLFHILLPGRRLISSMVGEGVAPWWNPYLYSGVPLAADVVHGLFYPLSIVFYLLPIHWAAKVFVVSHHFLAGVAFFVLLRQWRLGSPAALFGAVTYMLSGYLLSLSSVWTFLPGAAWLPLALAGFLRAIEPGRWRWIVPTGLVVALQGVIDQQSVVVFAGLATLWVVLPGERRGLRGTLRGLGLLAVGCLTAALLTAVQLAPLLELYPRSVRSGGVALGESLVWSFPPHRLVEFLAPQLYGDVIQGTYWGWIFHKDFAAPIPWLLSAYLGVPPLVFVALAGILRWRDRRVRFCLVVSTLTVLLAMGESTPLYPLFHRFIPLFGLFRFPAKWLLPATLGLAGAAAIALSEIAARRPADARRVGLALKGGVAVVLAGLSGLLALLRHPEWVTRLLARHLPGPPDFLPEVSAFAHDQAWTQGLVALGLLAVTLLVLYGLSDGQFPDWLAQGVLIVLLTLDLLAHNGALVALAPRAVFDEEPPLARFLKADPDLFRIQHVETQEQQAFVWAQTRAFFHPENYRWYRSVLAPNTAMEYGLSEFWGTSAVELSDYRRVAELVVRNRLDPRLLGAWNVKYVIMPITEVRHPAMESVAVPGLDSRVHLYRNRMVLPRAFWVPRAKWIPDREHLFRSLLEFDPRQEVLLEGPEEPSPSAPDVEGAPRVGVATYRPDEVVIRSTAATPGFLVLSDTYYPGWRVTVDGRERPLLRANYTMRAVQLEAGAHEVRFRYEPWSVRLGAAVSLATLLAVGGAMAVPLVHARAADGD